MGVDFENSVGYSIYEGRMETVKYIWMNIEKLQECTPSAQSRSTVKERKKWNAVLSIWTADYTHTERYHTVKVCVFLRGLLLKILGILNKFCEIQTKGWLRKILNVANRTTNRKWELNTCRNFVNLRTDDSCVDRCRSKIYTMWKYYQNIQQNIYNE